MSAVIEIEGTLREDGTLVLDEKPALPPGRVKVRVEATKTSMREFFTQIRQERESLGIASLSREQIDDYLAEMRDDEERTGTIERIQRECTEQRRAKLPEAE